MKTIKPQFDLHTRLFINALADIDNKTANKRINKEVNHLIWLAGHVTSVRMSFLKIAGLPEDNSFEEFFGHGKPIDSNKDYPSLEIIITKFNEVSPKVSEALLNIPEAVLSSKAPVEVPFSDPSMLGFLGFLMHHEAYHIGQMGILRRYLGKEAMSYK